MPTKFSWKSAADYKRERDHWYRTVKWAFYMLEQGAGVGIVKAGLRQALGEKGLDNPPPGVVI